MPYTKTWKGIEAADCNRYALEAEVGFSLLLEAFECGEVTTLETAPCKLNG